MYGGGGDGGLYLVVVDYLVVAQERSPPPPPGSISAVMTDWLVCTGSWDTAGSSHSNVM